MNPISKMADIAICLLKISCIFAKSSSKNKCCFVPLLYFALILPAFASHEKITLIEVSKLEKTSQKRLTAGDHSSGTDQTKYAGHKYWGKLLDLGRENNVDGRLHLLPVDCSEDDSSVARLPGGWVAVLNYTDKLGTNTVTAEECPGVVERMKKALFFGASAIIILTLNPKIIKEMEISPMFSRPVVLVDITENITHMLHLLSGRLRLKARFLYNISQSVTESQKYFTTVSLWGTCGRYSGRTYHEWDGVVCLGYHEPQNNKDGKVDVENFWNYFYTAILVLMMLHYIRTRREQDWENPDYIDGQIRELAYRALAVMKIKRYTPDGMNDTCAICLEKFYVKQKLRVLPCGHYFHTKCVDPWLVRNHTCPLCKLNIIEKLENNGD